MVGFFFMGSMNIVNWIISNWLEITGAVIGFIYIYFSIKQNIWTWPLGLATSFLYIFVFFFSKFYADMSLQFYYVVISIYGWYSWRNGDHQKITQLQVSRTSLRLWVKLFLVNWLLFVLIATILVRFTDSPLPYWDAFTTALSIVATWMLARKKIEHWLIWIVVDAVSMGLYIYKGLFATTILFLVYTVMAGVGYYSWLKSIKQAQWKGEGSYLKL